MNLPQCKSKFYRENPLSEDICDFFVHDLRCFELKKLIYLVAYYFDIKGELRF